MQYHPNPHQQGASQLGAVSTSHDTSSGRIPIICHMEVRHILFKIAFGGLFFSAVVLIIGMFSPAWYDLNGLWIKCSSGVCTYFNGDGPLSTVRVLEVLALLALFVCLAVLLYQDVVKTPPPPENKTVEILASLAGVLGLIGVAVYGKYHATSQPCNSDLEGGRAVFQRPRTGEGGARGSLMTGAGDGGRGGDPTSAISAGNLHHHHHNHGRKEWGSGEGCYLNWAYGMTVAGCTLVLICALMIAYSRVKHASFTSSAMAARGIFFVPAKVLFVPPGSTLNTAERRTNSAAAAVGSRRSVGPAPTSGRSGLGVRYLPSPSPQPRPPPPPHPSVSVVSRHAESMELGAVYPELPPYSAYPSNVPPGGGTRPSSSASGSGFSSTPMLTTVERGAGRSALSHTASAPPTLECNRGSGGGTGLNDGASTSASSLMPPAQDGSAGGGDGSGVVTSSIPVYYVMNQGQAIPVFNKIPKVIVTEAP